MKTRMSIFRSLALAILSVGAIPQTTPANPLYRVTNVSPSPLLTNEFYLTATNLTVSINGTNVRAMVYKDVPPSGGGAPVQLPGPLIEANVGQTIICHFKNNLTNNLEGASIHWHGIELDNDSDGTAVSQDTIFSGQTYTYRFIVSRPGLFWYHSHMIPGTTTFSGMYGPIIIHDTNETALIAANILPGTNYTFPLVLTDISFTNGAVGKVVNGVNYSLNTLIQDCENGVLSGSSVIPNSCGEAGTPGSVFLCNGSVPTRAGTFCAPTTNSAPVFYIGKNQRIRLQIFNESISRNAFLTLKYPCSNPSGNTNLYHIGGQGGLLDSAVLDGGVVGGYDFLYPKGTINLGSGMREDVMFYSSGNNGDVIQLLGMPLVAPWKLSTFDKLGTTTNYPVAFFVVTNGGSTNALLAAGSPLLTAIGVSTENLSLLNTNLLVPPPAPAYGTQNGLIVLSNGIPLNGNGVNTGPTIGGYAATALDGNSGNGSWPNVPHPPTALWARAGDVLQLAIANDTQGQATHPYHLHGFSMQPVAIYSANLQTNLYTFPFNEFVDTMDVLPGQALVYRIKLADRPVLADTATGGPLTTGTDSPTGGNLGRWLMHCHIFLHGAIGMISELVVVPNTVTRLVSASAGTNSVISTESSSWIATANAPWLHLIQTSGSGHTTVLFTYDANLGATRFGTLNIGGQTVEVTQAGTTYVQSPGPLTGLVTNGISTPFGIGVDSNGRVYFSAAGSGAVKRWDPSNNTVFTVASGLSSPYGLAVDSLDRAIFAQYGNTAIRMYSDASGISTLFNNDVTGVAGLAVDDGGNVYITVPGEHLVKKWTAATSALTSFTTNGLIAPWGVAVDKAAALYASDIGDDSVKKLGIRIISFFPLIIIPYWNTVITSNDLSNPYNLAVDDGGNIFVADYSHSAIKKFSAASNTVTTVVSGLNSPTGVTVDKTGNTFLSDWGANVVKELPYAFVDPTPQSEPAEVTVDHLPVVLLPDENLLPPFAPTPNASWIFYGGSTAGVAQFAVGANLGGPRSGTITVLGQPITINQDGASWKLAVTNLLVGPAAGSNTVTELVIPSIGLWGASTATPWLHLPFTSGTGSGNIVFTYDKNTGATRTGTITINGISLFVTQAGASYVPAIAPATTLVSGVGYVNPVDVAADNFGNVIIADSGNNTVKRWSPGGFATTTLMSGFIPQGVDVDDFGNVYASDFVNFAIKQWRAADSNVVTLVNTPSAPSGISVGYGTNVYWAMPTPHSVNEWIASNSNSVVTVTAGLTSPRGVSVDIAGNVYIADTGGNALRKWNPVTLALTTLVGSSLNSPWDCIVDGSGNVYVANGFNNNIVEWVAASGTVITNVPGGLGDPTGVGVDAAQNIYIADFNNGAVKELPHAFIDTTTKFEPFTAGNDSLATVLPSNQNLTASLAPTDNAAWLNITTVINGVVSFSFTQNPGNVPRNADITLLGQNILVTQAAAPPTPIFSQINLLSNGVVRFNFTNTVAGGPYTVLFTTNLTTPTAAWSVLGPASPVGADLWQFTDLAASNNARFYRIRTP